MFPLFESIRFEKGQFHNLDLHQARIDKAFGKLFRDYLPINLKSFVKDINPGEGIFKCRFSYNQESGSLSIEPYLKEPPLTLKIVVDNTIRYDFKYVDRSELDRLYGLRSGNDDVLIVRNNLITDTSYGNICLEMNGNWFTPSKPLFLGIQRDFSVREGRVFEKNIPLNELFKYDHFIVINAMLPFKSQRAVPINKIRK